MLKQKFLTIIFSAIIVLVFNQSSCDKKKNNTTDCINQSKISTDPCTMDYDPVCGCDTKTYSNSCVAEHAGVTKWTQGACK